MRNYLNVFLLPFLLIIFFTFFSGFAGTQDSMLVEELLKERTEILHKVYFREIEPERGEVLLYEIETQPLLASDIKSLRAFVDTDLDPVKSMQILVLEQISGLYGYKSYRGEILWHMKGPDGDYVQSVDYNIVLKKSGSGYKLSEFNAITP
ncbi:MAG: hypothetical protein ACOX4J_02840 [Anaerovoracaceae bacterium]|jgi:hypothetical protein